MAEREYTDEELAALREFDRASDKLKEGGGLVTSKGGNGRENTYAVAYQKLVAMGLARQLRTKYRPR